MFFLCAHSGLQNCEFFLVCHMFLTGWKTGMSESESDSKSKSESGTPKDSSSGNLCWRFVDVGFFFCAIDQNQNPGQCCWKGWGNWAADTVKKKLKLL